MANTGRVVQVQGGVVDVEFADGQLPELFEALEIEREGQTPLVLEVQKFLGDNWVRTVSMDTTDGLQRGVDAVENVSVGVARGQDGAVDHLASVATRDEFHVYPTRLLKCLDEALGQGEGIMGHHPNDPRLGRGSRIR